MRATHAGVLLFAATLPLYLAACVSERTPTLTGAWSGVDREGYALTLVFEENDRLLWIADRVPGVQDTTVLGYLLDTAANPDQMDISGFTSGPLAGMTLFGIYEVVGRDSLRLDYEPGLPGERAVRPDSFTSETLVLTRR